MDMQTIVDVIRHAVGECEVRISGEGCNFSVVVVSPSFRGQPRIVRHRLINKAVAKYIRDGSLHALSINALAPEEVPPAAE